MEDEHPEDVTEDSSPLPKSQPTVQEERECFEPKDGTEGSEGDAEEDAWLVGAIATLKSGPDEEEANEEGKGDDSVRRWLEEGIVPDIGPRPKSRVVWATDLVTQLDSNSVTVKFILGPSKVFTRAYKIYCNIKEIKDDLASVFKVPVESLCLSKEGEPLEESLPLAGLGIEPFGTVELTLGTAQPEKYPLSTSNIYEEFATPDVLTVRIETEKGQYKEIVVEIENRCIKKPFLGGYRHRVTGVEYHHAYSQTQPRISAVPPEGFG